MEGRWPARTRSPGIGGIQCAALSFIMSWSFNSQSPKISMHEFIRTLASNLSQPGCAIRAQAILDQAMARGHFRWGRKSKLVAGASVAIASRESNKSVSLRDIAVRCKCFCVSTYLTPLFSSISWRSRLHLLPVPSSVHAPFYSSASAFLSQLSTSLLSKAAYWHSFELQRKAPYPTNS